MKPIKPIYVLILVIIFAAGSFYGGVQYQKNHASSGFAQDSQGNSIGGSDGKSMGGRPRMFQSGTGGRQGMRPVNGEIVSQDSKSITVKLDDGSSKIINFTDQTKINKTTESSATDLKSGERVTAFGSTNSDGSVTAENIAIGGGMMRMQQPK